VAFGPAATHVRRPRQGRSGLLALLAELRDARRPGPDVDAPGPQPAPGDDLGHALRSVAALANQRGLVVVVSDFRGAREWIAPLRRLRARHGILAIEIRDPRELALVPAGDLWLTDPETGRMLRVNTSRRKVRERFAAAAQAERAEVAEALRDLGAEHLVLSTEGDWLLALAAHLRRPATRRAA
jgi:hypothetical protein